MNVSSILSTPKSFFGKQKVWMTEGNDLVLFNQHRSNIQNLLRHSSIPESNHRLWIGLYRIGTTEDEAKTVVVVSCSDKRIRKLTRDFLSICPIFQPGGCLAQFKVISKATPPEISCEPRLTMKDETERLEDVLQHDRGSVQQDTNQKLCISKNQRTLRVFPSITGDSYLCRRVQVQQWSPEGVQSQSATVGPLIWLDGRTYQLTVEHVLNFDVQKTDVTVEPTCSEPDDWDDDEDDHASRCSIEEEVASWNISARSNKSPESSPTENTDDDFSDSLSSNSVLEIVTGGDDSPVITNDTSVSNETSPERKSYHTASSRTPSTQGQSGSEESYHLVIHDSSSAYQLDQDTSLTPCPASSKLDYLLMPIPITSEKTPCVAESAEIVQLSETFNVYEQREARPVIMATSSLGYVQGIMFPAPVLSRSPGSRDFQSFFSVKSKIAMTEGSSGSAVFDTQTGLLAGHIVLGCPEKNIWYMAPLSDTLNDLEIRLSYAAKCHIRLDVATAVGLGNPSDISSVTEAVDHLDTHRPTKQRLVCSFDRLDAASLEMSKAEVNSKPMKSILDLFLKKSTPAIRGRSESSLRYDAWRTQFGSQAKLPENDEPLLGMLKRMNSEVLEVALFMLCHPETARMDRIWYIQGFCDGAFQTSETSQAVEVEKPRVKDALQPMAWVHKIGNVSGDPTPDSHGKALNKYELYGVLQDKHASRDSRNSTANMPWCIYINNPDGYCIMALLRTARISEAPGFRQLFYNYVTDDPESKIGFEQYSASGNLSFVISINLSFCVIKNHDRIDTRYIAGTGAFRCRYNISFLEINHEASCTTNGISPDPQHDQTYLYEATWSMIVTGTSEQYWTAVCLNDDFCEEQEADNDNMEDPTVLPRPSEPVSPRLYALKALGLQLERIITYHENIQEAFRQSYKVYDATVQTDLTGEPGSREDKDWMFSYSNSLERAALSNSKLIRNIEGFLGKDLMVDSDDVPRGPLWRSISTDSSATESLRKIRLSLGRLQDMKIHMDGLIYSMQKTSQKVNLQNSRRIRERRVEQITIAAFVLAIFSVVLGTLFEQSL